MGGKVIADYVENVNEDQSAIPVIRDLAKSGHKLIFTTSFGYMDQTLQVASEFPDVKFEHCTGYKRAAERRRPTTTASIKARAVMGTIVRHVVEDRHHRLSRLVQGARSGDGRELLHAGRAGGEPEDQGQAGDDRFLVRSRPRNRPPPKRSPTSAATSSPPTPIRPAAAAGLREEEDLSASARAPTCRALRRTPT